MKIVIINTSERIGGAAIAANRLMKALISNGIEAKSLVLKKQSDDVNVISIQTSTFKKYYSQFNFLWERFVIFFCNHFSRKNLFQVSIANTGLDMKKLPIFKSDIHLVAVSLWLGNKAGESRITNGLNISVIPNVIDTDIFSVKD